MKLFAIVTAGLMAAGTGVYFFSTTDCSKPSCGASASHAPVAKTGGCCLKETAVSEDCCAAQAECCATVEACCAVASAVSVQSKAGTCCAAKDECCLVQAACCTAEAVRAAAKPREIKGCCDEACAPATVQTTVSAAAASIANVK